MTPETVNLLINLGGTGVLIWVVLQLQQEIKAQREEARKDREQLWELLSFLVKAQDSRTDIPTLPSSRKE